MLEDAYDVRNMMDVINNTWGHLKPKEDQMYGGWILYTVGCYGDIVCIDVWFDDLDNSPWLYEDLHEFIGSNGEEEGNVYRWKGTYQRNRKKKFMGKYVNMNSEQLRSIFHQVKGE